jgi:hypothetical protein
MGSVDSNILGSNFDPDDNVGLHCTRDTRALTGVGTITASSKSQIASGKPASNCCGSIEPA